VQLFTLAPEQVAQLGSQLPQTVFALALQALSWNWFDAQVEQAGQVLPFSQAPLGQLVHEVAEPAQVAQLGSQLVQTVLEVPPQAALTYWFAAQVEQSGQELAFK